MTIVSFLLRVFSYCWHILKAFLSKIEVWQVKRVRKAPLSVPPVVGLRQIRVQVTSWEVV